MPLIHVANPWDSQPQSAVEIDRENPLGKTITHCIPLNGINREIVTGAALTLGSGGSIKPASMPRGSGLSLRGTGSTTRASIPIDLSPYTKLSLSFWMYWDAFANNDALAMEYGAVFSANSGFLLDPNSGVPFSGLWSALVGSPTTANGGSFTRPSAAAWHHYVFLLDRTTGAANGVSVFVDGVPVSVTPYGSNADVGDNFANNTLYLLSRNNTSLWGTGNLCNIVFRGGYLMSAQEALAEYQNPWQIFVPPSIDIWAPSAGGTSDIAASGGAVAGGSADLSVSYALAAVAVAVAGGSAALSAAVPLAATGLAIASGSAGAVATVTIAATALAQAAGAAGLSVTVTLAASGGAVAGGSATLSSSSGGSIAASGGAVAAGSALMSATVQISAAGLAQAMGSGALSISIPLAAFGHAVAGGQATLSTGGLATGPLILAGSARRATTLAGSARRAATLRGSVAHV